MVRRFSSFALWSALLFGFGGSLFAQEITGTFGGFADVIVEPLPEAPYEQEMVLIKIRGIYAKKPARHSLVQPIILDAGWMQLGSDSWTDAMHEGKPVNAYERVMAIFPQKPGKIEIGAFEHRMTFHALDGSWVERVLRSEPVVIEVRPKPATEGWWLPARGLTLTDSWDRDPDQLGQAELAHRTVTLEARGVEPGRLPPAPEMRSPGIMSFSDPEERSHELTPEGPVSRVTWRWTVRSITSTPAIIEEVRIPWFETTTRELREEVLKEQRVALAGSEALELPHDSLIRQTAAFAIPIGLLLGALAAAALLIPGLRFRSRREFTGLLQRLRPDPMVKALRTAARKGDAAAVRSAVQRLLRRDRAAGREGVLQPAVFEALTRLDQSLFAQSPKLSPAPLDLDLRALVRGFLRARRR